jgi:hypothetical protein
MYACMHAIPLYVHVYTYICMHVCIQRYCMHTCIQRYCMHTCMHVCMQYLCMCMYTRICECMYTCIMHACITLWYVCVRRYVCVCIYVCMYTLVTTALTCGLGAVVAALCTARTLALCDAALVSALWAAAACKACFFSSSNSFVACCGAGREGEGESCISFSFFFAGILAQPRVMRGIVGALNH